MEKFRLEENGYNREDVNKFIREVIEETDKISKLLKKQQEEIEALNAEVKYYKEKENTVKDAIIKAEEASANIKKTAYEEKDQIINEAKQNASNIVNEALLQTEQIEFKNEILKKNTKILKRKLKIILQEQMSIIDEIDSIEQKEE